MYLPESSFFKNSLARASGLVLMSVPGMYESANPSPAQQNTCPGLAVEGEVIHTLIYDRLKSWRTVLKEAWRTPSNKLFMVSDYLLEKHNISTLQLMWYKSCLTKYVWFRKSLPCTAEHLSWPSSKGWSNSHFDLWQPKIMTSRTRGSMKNAIKQIIHGYQ